MPYVNDGDGMHTVTDPADDATYVAAYAGMDLAHRVFACFDQPDLKAPITLTVPRPDDWTVVANGRLVGERRRPAGPSRPRRRSRRTSSPCAPGPWHSRTWEHAGLPFGWHARASLAAELDRDFDDMREVTERVLRLLHQHLRRAVPVRLLRPGDGARPQLGRHGDRGLRHLPRRVPPPQRARRRRAGRPGHRDRPRDGAHVVRRPGDDEVVAGHLAQRVVRRLHGLPRGPRGRRARLAGPTSRSTASRPGTPRTRAARPTRSPRTPSTSSTSTPPSPTST